MSKVFLVTKLQTTNLGNHALSMELIKLFEDHVGKENLHVAGRPVGLFGYSIDELIKSKDPLSLFESWADAVIKKYKPVMAKGNSFVPKIHSFNLTTKENLKFEGLKKLLRPLKRKLNKLKLFSAGYARRLDVIQSADYIAYSGAGEVGDNHVFLRQLLELRIAQKLGVKTAAVNQSVVVNNPAMLKVVGLVYNNMARVVVRGQTSKSNIVAAGVDSAKVFIVPDTAINTVHPTTAVVKNGKVGFNITPFIQFDWKDVERIFSTLKKYNREVVFITNEPSGDEAIINKMTSYYGVPILSDSDDYHHYAAKLAEFEYVISARLHTNVMAIAAHVPVIPIEGRVWKTRELFTEFEYPLPTANVAEPDWTNSVIHSIEKIESKQIDFPVYFQNTLAKHKERVKENATWIP